MSRLTDLTTSALVVLGVLFVVVAGFVLHPTWGLLALGASCLGVATLIEANRTDSQ